MPKELQACAVQIAHEGHQGLVKTKALLREKVWFPQLDNKVITEAKDGCTATKVIWAKYTPDECNPFKDCKTISDLNKTWHELKKRKALDVDSQNVKRIKRAEKTIDEIIKEKIIGTVSIPRASLVEPPPELLVRQIDPAFVKQIQTTLRSDGMISTIIPVLIKEEERDIFDRKMYEECSFIPLGGNHLRNALASMDKNTFSNLEAVVYSGLSKTEALRVASRHNISTGTTHQSTFEDNVSLCRNILQDYQGSDSKTKSTWRRKCAEAIGKSSFEKKFFMNLQGLSDEDRLTVLTSVTDGNRTIKEAEQDARNTKLLKELKRKFLKTTKVLTWEEAEVRFPQHTTEAALREFITTRKLSKNEMPTGLLNHCHDAQLWEQQQQYNSSKPASTVNIMTEQGLHSMDE
ncbi:uncharacterized protein LOC117099940 [Anneissia japonica]|uniref:uncharacterized protein LOC117099940 n=1 Tax=Anneissia japonica TaxID=1529436 RepID=UPI0014255ABE|nr:uncharacterized protein LOC117099940 [Anneissia japonica]